MLRSIVKKKISGIQTAIRECIKINTKLESGRDYELCYQEIKPYMIDAKHVSVLTDYLYFMFIVANAGDFVDGVLEECHQYAKTFLYKFFSKDVIHQMLFNVSAPF